MQIQPYTRQESRPTPHPESNGALVERPYAPGYNDWSGHAVPNGTPHSQVLPQLAPQPPYFQVLLEKILLRWKLLAFWLVLTAVAAGYVVSKYGKPVWRAEGSLYYSPNHRYSHKPLYTPPNMQTVLALARSPEVLEKVRKEMNLGVGLNVLQSKMTVNIVKQSDLIAVALDWPNKEEGEKIANRVLELSIDQYDQLLHRLSGPALAQLDLDLKTTREEELACRQNLNDILAEKGISNLDREMDIVQSEISSLDSQIKNGAISEMLLANKRDQLDARVKKLLTENNTEYDVGLSENEINIKRMMTDIQERKILRQREIEQAKIRLKALDEEYRRNFPVYQKGYISKSEWAKLIADIESQKAIISGSKDLIEMERSLEEHQNSILNSKKINVALPLQQVRLERINIDIELTGLPKQIKDLQKIRDERFEQQKKLKAIEKEVMPLVQQIKGLDQRRTELSGLKHDHQNLETNKVKELTLHSTATAGGAPFSSNYFKLGIGVFALSLLLFVGFVAVRDMPSWMPYPVAGPAHLPIEPGSQLPVPVWQLYPPPHSYAPPPATAPRGPSMNNEHLRALAERIIERVRERGSIIEFTPLVRGLRVEALLGDLACFCLREGEKILVFEARTDVEGPSYPPWTGPSSRGVAEEMESYLKGDVERSAACFAETLLTSVDYARGDLSRLLTNVMAMYRFRRLMHDIKDRYAMVMMITPERSERNDGDDVYATLAEGIVVVINQDADPVLVEEHLRRLRASDTPVFGAVTVPPAKG